jgi:uncharacterized membrane protein (DUF485 family)
MLHEPAAQSGKDPAFAYKRTLGARLFGVYAAFYASFIVVNLVSPKLMETPMLAGLNLAVVFGFTLIIAALALALVYNRACSRREAAMAEKAGN